MKKLSLFIFLFSILTAKSTYADSLNCKLDVDDPNVANHTYVIADSVAGDCDGRHFEISGIGPGLRIAVGSVFMISCPGVSNRRFAGRYYGIKADVSVAVGADAGIYLGRNGLCVIGGLAFGLGADVTGSVLTIK